MATKTPTSVLCGNFTHALAVLASAPHPACCFCGAAEEALSRHSVVSFRPSTSDSIFNHPEHFICRPCFQAKGYEAARAAYWMTLREAARLLP